MEESYRHGYKNPMTFGQPHTQHTPTRRLSLMTRMKQALGRILGRFPNRYRLTSTGPTRLSKQNYKKANALYASAKEGLESDKATGRDSYLVGYSLVTKLLADGRAEGIDADQMIKFLIEGGEDVQQKILHGR